MSLKNEIEKAIKWKQTLKDDEMQRAKIWDEKYINDIYTNKSNTILDFFFKKPNKEREVLVMRQHKTDLKTDIFGTFDETDKLYNIKTKTKF